MEINLTPALDFLTGTERCLADAKQKYADDQKIIGAYLRMKRVEQKVSLRAVARRMKRSAPYVSDLELGLRNWSQATLHEYGEAMASMPNAEVTGDPLKGSKL